MTFPTPIELWLTFITALLASGHCIGMCGGMVAALGVQPKDNADAPPRPTDFMLRHLLYGLGRLSTYLFLGGISGWLGSMAPAMERSSWGMALPLLLAGIVMIVMGLDTWGWGGLNLSRGGRLGGWVKTMGRGKGWQKPAALGILTGLLPCGLHWAFQAKAFATGSVAGGLAILTAFGLGTLPAMLGLGWIIVLLGPGIRQRLQRAAALLVIAMGIMAVFRGLHKANLW
ncbi:MAG: sulfite exporter TauE/SafE family protein [Magnetococcales bacterium]|nr:sulfite exporter TauE/SafE family protein [Magnetococcales bacterium]MBF0151235.1 sulfite exporter TauE/SafE family protein [Magnetococcales bacterium]MBF0349029.1 sulfite exporter TauE/SafE family protein [Magnetococcales bacterium]MBF0632200.1 sulfite exporter TauE/SafE family protein [Magnetococcales bacterium]